MTDNGYRFGGLAADSVGIDDERPPLLLMHGLTYDRTMWRPVLAQLERLDPGRRVVSIDLPGHGDSASLASHDFDSVVEAVHRAVLAAGLDAPVLVGHSMAGGLASFYAAAHPARGVISVDSPPEIRPFVAGLRGNVEAIRGPGFPAVWARLEGGFRTDLLPPEMADLVRRSSRPDQELALSYWAELLSGDVNAFVTRIRSVCDKLTAEKMPAVLVLSSDYPPEVVESTAEMLPAARIEIWPGHSHFPHLADPERFAGLLVETGR